MRVVTTRSPAAKPRPARDEEVVADPPARAQLRAGPRVELGDVCCGGGRSSPRSSPPAWASHQAPTMAARALVGARGDDEPALLLVGGGEGFDVAASQRVQRPAVPRLALPADLPQLDGAERLGQRAEGAAGLDLGQLAVVADEDELGSARRRRPRASAARSRVPTMPASSTISTLPGASVAPCVEAAWSSRAIVVASMPVWSRSSHAARADSAQPSTGMPLRCQASTAAPSANVLPVPAAARTTWTPSPLRVSDSTSSRCSALSVGPRLERDADRVPAPRRPAVAAPARGGAVEQPALDRQQLAGRVARLAAVIRQRHDLRRGRGTRSRGARAARPGHRRAPLRRRPGARRGA